MCRLLKDNETAASAFCTGVVLFCEYDYGNALAWFSQTKAICPQAAGLHKYLGYCYFQLGKYRKAINALRIAYGQETGNALICSHLGFCYVMSDAPEVAIAWYERGLKIEPANADLHQEYGSALMHVGHLDASISEFRKALDFDSSLYECLYNMGLAYQRKHDYQSAIYYQEQALKLAPRHPVILENLEALYRSLGMRTGSLYYTARLWESSPLTVYPPATRLVC